MPRRLPQDHDTMRARAVAVARAMVARSGHAGLTARALAAELGCSVGSLYNLFRDLDDVVLHVAAAVVADLAAALFAPPLPAAPHAAVGELAQRYVRFAAAEGRCWSMVFEHEPGHDRPTPRWYLDEIDRIVEGVRAVAAPAWPDRDADTVRTDVEVLWAAVHGIAALAQKGKLGFVTTSPAEDLARRLVDALLARSSERSPP
jgi:AcrR family transcriptional regulator